MKYLVPILLVSIVLIALFLRVYKLDKIPPSLYWDEVSVGYNAFSIANHGIDEWGKTFPLVFKSFGEYKNPVHIYITAIFVKFLGLSDFSTRISSALFGVFNVILLYLLVIKFFKSKLLGLIGAFLLAVSSYNLQFSRFNHELNFALFFFMLGILLFYHSLSNNKLFIFSLVSFLLSFLSYNAAKILIPAFLLVLFTIHFNDVKKFGTSLWASVILVALFILLVFFNPDLLGLERLKQTSPGDSDLMATNLYQKTHMVMLGKAELIADRYLMHFTPNYLFISGDTNPRHSIQTVGEFYKTEMPFLVIGFLALLFYILKKKNKEHFLLLSWALLGPVAAAITNEAPHAARAMFTMGSWQVVAALGIYVSLMLIKNRLVQIAMGIVVLVLISLEFKSYIEDYYQNYSTHYAHEWQYGMSQIGEYVRSNQDSYHTVYMTNVRHQPYIFLLYYLKFPTKKFISTVVPSEGETSGFNRIASFDKYNFEWEVVSSFPEPGVLYILTPSEYGGLAMKESFEARKVIKYPDGGDAFFLVSAKDIDYE